MPVDKDIPVPVPARIEPGLGITRGYQPRRDHPSTNHLSLRTPRMAGAQRGDVIRSEGQTVRTNERRRDHRGVHHNRVPPTLLTLNLPDMDHRHNPIHPHRRGNFLSEDEMVPENMVAVISHRRIIPLRGILWSGNKHNNKEDRRTDQNRNTQQDLSKAGRRQRASSNKVIDESISKLKAQ